MPFIRVTTNVMMDTAKENALREKMAVIVRDILGKDPVRMMTAFEGGVHIMRGMDIDNPVPTAFIECKFFGGPKQAVFTGFDAMMQRIYKEELGIATPDLYIKYEVINGWEESARIFKI